MPVLINNGEQAYAEDRLLTNKKKQGGPKTYAGTGAKIGAGIGAGGSALGLAAGAPHMRYTYKAARAAGMGRGRAGLALAGGAALGAGINTALHSGVGAGIGAFFKRKKPTTNEEPMSTVFVNNSEQLRVEHQVLLNRLTARMQPQQMVDNGIGQLLSRAGGGIKKAAGRFSESAANLKVGYKYGTKAPNIAKGSIRSGAKGAVATGMKAGLATRKAGKYARIGATKAGRFAKANPKTAIGIGAGAGAAGVGGLAMSRKKRQVA